MKNIVLAFTLIIFAVQSCKKDSDNENSTIVVEKPLSGQFSPGDTIFIKATATDAEEMHNFKAWLITTGTYDTLWQSSTHSHGGRSLSLNKYYVVEYNMLTPGEIRPCMLLLFAENKTGNAATKSVQVELHSN